jgi:hypothetical protein
MSTELKPETVTLREFGKAVADGLEYLATVIQTSHSELRAEMNTLTKDIGSLTKEVRELVAEMKAARPKP